MEKSIKGAISSILKPMIDQIKDQTLAEMRMQEHKQVKSLKPDSILKETASNIGDEIESFIIGQEDINLLEKGFSLVLKELENHPNKETVLQEIKHAAERMVSGAKDIENDTLAVYNTIQEMLGLSTDTFQTLYRIGADFFHRKEMEKALSVFVLLTNLNNLVFEPWLGLGLCRKHFENIPEALHAFSMASLINFQHPAPHLYAAECYQKIEAYKLAKETLQLALSKMDENQKKDFKPRIDSLQQYLKQTKGKT